MKSTQHGAYLLQLIQFRAINAYLLEEEDGLTLIDAGMSGSTKGIMRAIEQYGKPLTRITLTHAHGDHVGDIAQIVEAYPEADLALGARTAAFLRDGPFLLPDEPQDKLSGSYVTCDVQADRTVTDGDQIGSLRVITTPGHSPDHLSFLDVRDGTLIAGDAFQTLGGIAVSGVMRWRFPLPAVATWQPALAAQSAAHLLALKPTRLAVGHGRVLDDPLDAMTAAVEEAGKNTRIAVYG
ncbi:MAG: MBL fold metallo-hydrolase [Caldilineaceae bacterium]|nr:MBL fold metallo-hydrolase [Caldilineaceae bacterium]